MASVEIQDSLTYLERLEDCSYYDPSMKDVLGSLKLIISNRSCCFPRGSFWWKIECKRLKVRLLKPATPFANGIEDSQIRGGNGVEPGSTTVKMVLSNLETLRLIKLETECIISGISKFLETASLYSSKIITFDCAKTVVDFIHGLLGILKDILGCESDHSIIPVKEQIKSLEEKLRFLRNFIWFVYKIGTTRYLLNFAEAVAVNTVCLLYFWLLHEKDNEEEMTHEVKTGISVLVENINPLQSDVINIYFKALSYSRNKLQGTIFIDEYFLRFYDSLVDNLKELSKTSSMVAEDQEIQLLLKELTFLRHTVLDSSLLDCTEELKDLTTSAAEIIRCTGTHIFSYIHCKRKQERFRGWNDVLDLLKRNVEDIKRKCISPKIWHSGFPRTNEIGFVDFLVKDLKKRKYCQAPSYDILKPLFETILKELVSLAENINPILEFRDKNEELRVLFTNYKDVMYVADYILDACFSGSKSLWYQKMELFILTENIQNVHEEIKSVTKRMNDEDGGHDIVQSLNHASTQIKPPRTDAGVDVKDVFGNRKDEDINELVGLEDESNKIIDELTRGSKQLKILSLVGMPGLGKTTLANYVYNDPSITLFFHVRAWCCVSQVYERETLLCGILQQIVEKKIHSKLNAAEKLYRSLRGKRYLVVIDDIWTIEAWHDLKECFPDDNNGSRIIFTTRQHTVALKANSIPHALRMLSNEESWKLLQVKVYKEKTCPPELSQVGKIIAETCKGLPLSVILMAGLLRKTQRDEYSWEDVAKRLRSHELRNPQKQHYSILDASYSHLPDYLKPCFLYFGAFPEDADIPIRKLVHLWTAEGFVQQNPQTEDHNLETQAENYLNDLIDRSLVTVGKKSSRGGVKTCRVHDLLYEFCSDRSESEAFLLRPYRYARYGRLYEDDKYRISIHSTGIPEVGMAGLTSRIRSILLRNPENPLIFRDWNSSLSPLSLSTRRLRFHNFLFKFKILRVLDLSTTDVTKETDDCGLIPIFKLVYLRYLAVFANRNEIPGEIGNLKNLETFLLSGPIGEVVLPKSIWNILSLRHVQITHLPGGFFHLPCFNQELLEDFPQLDNMTSISNPLVRYGKDVEKLMRKLPNLQKLKCIFSASWDDSRKCNRFPVLDFLNRLETLKISFSGKVLCPCEFSFPSNLKKLTLSMFRLPWDEISVIGRLPNLEVLKLLTRAFEGKQWDMQEGEFQKLKFLKLDLIDIAHWNASNENFPVLEQLILHRCKHLEEIPFSFADISTLRMIEIKWCKTSAVDSVRQIQEELYDMGNEQLNVYISQPLQDFNI